MDTPALRESFVSKSISQPLYSIPSQVDTKAPVLMDNTTYGTFSSAVKKGSQGLAGSV
jgi:hypothetical protein